MIKRLAAMILTAALTLSMSGCFVTAVPKTSLSQTGGGYQAKSAYTGTSVFDPVYYPYYSLLNQNAKDAYAMIYDGLSAGQTTIRLTGGMTSQDVTDAFNMVLLDHPELFWVRTDFNYSYMEITGAVTAVTFNFYDFASTPDKLAKAKQDFDQAANAIISGARSYSTAIEKELYIHDAVNKAAEFDSNAKYSQSAYSVLVTHSSVCAGYSRAFQYLMQKSGIPCFYCIGSADGEAVAATGGTETSHSWNIVRLGNSYCNVDCMWDDSVSNAYGRNEYPFFNLTDKDFRYHTRTGQSIKLPACNDSTKSYKVKFGDTIEAKDLIFKK